MPPNSRMKCATVGGITPCCLVSVGSEWKSKIILNYCCIGCLLPIFHLCQGSLSPVSSCCSATLMLWIASVPSSRNNQSKCNRHFLRRHANAITTWQSVNLQRPMLIRLMQAMLCQCGMKWILNLSMHWLLIRILKCCGNWEPLVFFTVQLSYYAEH